MGKIWSAVLFLGLSPNLNAASTNNFLAFGPSAAILGMGETGAAIGQDVGVMHYNPAMLYRIYDQFMITHWFPNADKAKFDFFAFSTGDDSAGVAFSGERYKDDSATETIWRIGYAKHLRLFDVGGAIKWIRYSSKIWNKSRFAADIGIAKKIKKKTESGREFNLSYGLSVANIFQSTVNYQGIASLPVVIRGVMAISAGTILKDDYDDNFSIGLGFTLRDGIASPALGLQYALPSGIKFRLGQTSKFSVGLGWEYKDIRIDYAYVPLTKHNVLDFGYVFGRAPDVEEGGRIPARKKRVSQPLSDLQRVRNRATRVYDRYVRNANDLIKHELYEDARALLLKALPLTRENKNARELLEVCEKVIQTKKIGNLLSKANQNLIKNPEIALSHYFSAYAISHDAGILSVINELLRKKPELSRKRDIIVNNSIVKFDLLVGNNDFEKAKDEINFLEAFAKQTKIQELKERLDTAENIYITRLIIKASEHFDVGEYKTAFKYFQAAYKMKPDEMIKEKIVEIKEKYPTSKQDKMYAEKLYLIIAYNFATDDNYVVKLDELFDYDLSWNVDDLKYSIKQLKRPMPEKVKIELNQGE